MIVKEGVNKSNHPIQNPLLLVTEPRTRKNIYEGASLDTDGEHGGIVRTLLHNTASMHWESESSQ
jgi:hypothetical protein